MNKRIHWTIFAVLSLFSPALLALGLGGAVVESYLDQPLDVRIELISQSNEELQSITAGLASADDFELLGLSRTAITVPLEFELVTDVARPYIHVTSSLRVGEPVVQVLVEVVWASGRMLREYTLFLDPPTIDSPAPPVVVKPAPVSAPPVESKAPPIAAIQKTPAPGPEKVATPEPALETPGSGAEKPTDSAAEDLSSGQTAEQSKEPAEEQEPATESPSEGEVYGPVARGETLWGIAREYSKGSGYSINQAMLALQRKNPEAFIKDNINSLKSGAILRLPAFSELGELTSRQAMLEVLRQEEELRTGTRSVAPDFTTPTVADSGDYQASAAAEAPEPELEEEEGYLELVPPALDEDQDSAPSEQVAEEDVAVESLKEELSRTEEELVNARQENTYLADRIQELEAEARLREEEAVAVTDSGLASMESKLAQDRAAGQPEPPLAITPGGEKQAWYAGKTALIGGVAIVVIALIVWGLRRRSMGLLTTQRASEVQAIADDAEDILRTLDSSGDEGKTVVQSIPEPEPEPETEPEPEPELKPEPEFKEFPQIQTTQEDEGPTVVLQTPEVSQDTESGPAADFGQEDVDQEGVDQEGEDWEDEDREDEDREEDPEIKLDLARAYLSLGDKEASKSMLDEVIKIGSEAQKAEARQMLDEL